MSHIQALTIGNARLRFLRAGKCMRQSTNWLWPHSSRHFPDCGIQAEQSGLTELRSRDECLGQLKQLEFMDLRIRESRGPEVQMEFLCWPWAWGWRIQTDMAENSHAKLWLKQRDHFSGSHRSFWSLREEKTWKPHWAFIGHPKIATLGLGPCPRAGISKLFHKEPENKYSWFCGPSGCSCNTELCYCNWKAATDNA